MDEQKDACRLNTNKTPHANHSKQKIEMIQSQTNTVDRLSELIENDTVVTLMDIDHELQIKTNTCERKYHSLIILLYKYTNLVIVLKIISTKSIFIRCF